MKKRRFLSLNEFKNTLEDQHIKDIAPVLFKDKKVGKLTETSQINNNMLTITSNQNSVFQHNIFSDHLDDLTQNNNKTLPSLSATTYASGFKNLIKQLKEKTISNFQKSVNNLTNNNNFIRQNNFDTERNNLASFYHMSESQAISNVNYEFKKEKKKEYFQKYQIENQINPDEIQTINQCLKINENTQQVNKNMTSFKKKSSTDIDSSRTNFRVFQEYFKNPVKSLKKIKINKQIYNNMMLIANCKQNKEYMDKYNQVKLFSHRKILTK